MSMVAPFKIKSLSTNGGMIGPFKSKLSAIALVWTANPVISGEPWPGGIVNSDEGTTSDPSPAYAWQIGITPTGDTGATAIALAAGEHAGNLSQVGTAQPGSVTATSNVIALQRVRGITRPALDSDRAQTATFALPAANVTLIVECIGFASDASGNFASAYSGSNANIRLISNSGTLRAACNVAGTSDPTAVDLAGLPIVDGTTRWFAQATYDGAELRLRYAEAGAGSSTTAASAGSGSMVTPVAVLYLHERVAGNGSSGSFEAKVLDRVLSDAEFLAVVASPIGIASLDGDAAILAELMPTPGTATDGGAITTGTDVTSTGTITADASRLTWGGLNVA